jgi:hypothetical protein
MILISSMGGCASTSLIGWFSKRTQCNCFLNSEGLRRRGPGANSNGLKHRKIPPRLNDKYLLRKNSFNRSEINNGPIEKALFLYDTPYVMVPSLFGRRIASGHSKAITGKRPPHNNTLEDFLDRGEDSFEFYEQFDAWTNYGVKRRYRRLVVKFDAIWDYTDYILEFLDIDKKHLKEFPKKRNRKNRHEKLDDISWNKLSDIYKELDDRMKQFPKVAVI